MTPTLKAASKVIATLLVLVALPAFAQAGWLTTLTGSTQMSDAATSDGVVNFAVYANVGGSGNWVTDIAAGKTQFMVGADTSAQFVFFYQVVNNDPSGDADDQAIQVFKIANNGIPYSSAGFLGNSPPPGTFEGEVFRDTAGALTGPAGNRFLGSEGPFGDDDVDGTPTQSGPFLDTTSGTSWRGTRTDAVRPLLADVGTASGGFASFTFDLISSIPGTAKIATGGFSTLLFLTSNNGPVGYGRGDLRDGGALSDGDVPVHAPAPPSAVLFGIGCIGFFYLRKKWENRTCTATVA